MHWKDARGGGESEQRLYGLNAWAESPYYTERERAALAWTETVTRVAETHVPDDVYDRGEVSLFGEGSGGPDLGDRRHQRLEPHGSCHARRGGDVPAGRAS